jgi:hypothetical protein
MQRMIQAVCAGIQKCHVTINSWTSGMSTAQNPCQHLMSSVLQFGSVEESGIGLRQVQKVIQAVFAGNRKCHVTLNSWTSVMKQAQNPSLHFMCSTYHFGSVQDSGKGLGQVQGMTQARFAGNQKCPVTLNSWTSARKQAQTPSLHLMCSTFLFGSVQESGTGL